MSKKKCIMIGVGGMATLWTKQFWPPFSDRMEFAALVDVNREVLETRGQELGLPSSALFTDVREAFEKVEADFCCIVTPPAFHREAIELACARKLDILSEKPIADTWEDCCAIYKAVQTSGVKMLVTQNYRYTTRVLTLKKAVAELGAVNYAMGRYASDYRVRNSWGKFRHEIPHTLLVEGGIHHLDQLRNLCDADVAHIAGWEWHPGQLRGSVDRFRGSDSFDGEPCASFVLKMTNNTFAHYEGNSLETGKLNSWHSEFYRVECEGGAATLDKDHIVRIEERGDGGTLKIREVPNVKTQYEGHAMMPWQFLEWLDGGPTPPTALEDNIQSNAAMFAAIEASETDTTVDVQQFVKQATG